MTIKVPTVTSTNLEVQYIKDVHHCSTSLSYMICIFKSPDSIFKCFLDKFHQVWYSRKSFRFRAKYSNKSAIYASDMKTIPSNVLLDFSIHVTWRDSEDWSFGWNKKKSSDEICLVKHKKYWNQCIYLSFSVAKRQLSIFIFLRTTSLF